jgi:hypothetical protein
MDTRRIDYRRGAERRGNHLTAYVRTAAKQHRLFPKVNLPVSLTFTGIPNKNKEK